MDLASLSLLDSFKPPLPLADADWSNPLGTDNQGRDVLSAIMYRHADQPAGGRPGGGLRGGGRASRSAWSPATRAASLDSLLMRVADVQLTFPAILTALLVDGVIGAALPRHAARRRLQLYVLIFAIGISLLAAASPAPCAAPRWWSATRTT